MKHRTLTPIALALVALSLSGGAIAAEYQMRVASPGIKSPIIVPDRDPVLGQFAVADKATGMEAFAVPPPSSDSPGAFVFSTTTPEVIDVTPEGRVTILSDGVAILTVTQAENGLFRSASVSASFNVRLTASEYAAWSSTMKSSNVYLRGPYTAYGGVNTRGGVRTTIGVSKGKWYWEETVTGNPSRSCWTSWIGSGAVTSGYRPASYYKFYPGWGDEISWAGAARTGAGFPDSTVGGTFMYALDMDNGKLYLGLNGVWKGQPTAGGPGAPIVTGLTGQVYHSVDMYGSTDCSPGDTNANFGTANFKYAVPAGFNHGLYR